jgi:hypothetical protein
MVRSPFNGSGVGREIVGFGEIEFPDLRLSTKGGLEDSSTGES